MRWTVPLLFALLSGCADLPPLEPMPRQVPPGEPSPLARKASAPAYAPPRDDEATVLDMEKMLELLDRSPRLRAQKDMIEIETGSVIQASYMPNPNLMVEAEMIPIDDPGLSRSRNMVRIEQRIETAGKADARVALANERRQTAEATYFHARAKLMADAARELRAIVLVQEKIAVADRIRGLRVQLQTLSADLNQRGRLSDQGLVDVRVATTRARLAALDLQTEKRRRLANLESLLGVPPGSITGCTKVGATWLAPEQGAATTAILSRSSELILLDRKLSESRADLELQKSAAWPDVTAGLGYARGSRFGGDRESFFTVFFKMPIPIIDRNQGGQMRARAGIRAATGALESAATRLLNDWDGLRRDREGLLESRLLYSEHLVPELERGRTIAASAFAQGRTTRQDSVQAALKLEQVNLPLLDIELKLSDNQVDMIFLIGTRQR